MCTVTLLWRSDYKWRLLLAANRDEMANRPWLPPGHHWPDHPGIIAGLDQLAGGTWLGLNEHGVIATVLNRLNTLGPCPGRLSRGHLPLHALKHSNATAAVDDLLHTIDANAYRPFNMVIADGRRAYWLRCAEAKNVERGGQRLEAEELHDGLSMITAYDLNDCTSPRIRRYLPAFSTATTPTPHYGDWNDWIALMARRDTDMSVGPGGAMTVATETGFGTVCSSLIALPSPALSKLSPIWLFSPTPPGLTTFQPIQL